MGYLTLLALPYEAKKLFAQPQVIGILLNSINKLKLKNIPFAVFYTYNLQAVIG